ncbi:MAG: GEVED domain-containing protein [Aequorivita sp.]
MKKITLLMVFFIGLTGFMQAQEIKSSSQVDGLLNRLEQIGKYNGSVYDHFTGEEQQKLRSYFNTVNRPVFNSSEEARQIIATPEQRANSQALFMAPRNLTAADEAELNEAGVQRSNISYSVQNITPQNRVMSDIVPTAGAVEAFTPDEGDNFFDPGGPGGANTDGEPGNYPNCGCDTETTLAGVSEIEFLDFGINGIFDYLIIYDGTDDTGTVLYDNSETGANSGDKTLADFIASNGSASITGTSGDLFFFFHASAVVNWLGWDAKIITASGGGGGGSAYCIPEGTNSDRFIDNFSTTEGSDNISNMGSGFSAEGYGDFYDTHSVTQEQGETVEFSVDIEGGISGFRVWVDWNQDGEFDEVDEVAYASDGYANSQTGSITVPGDALEGDTRMRIVSHWLSTTGDVDPCETGFTYGEFEDYKFTVEEGSGGPGGDGNAYSINNATRMFGNFDTTDLSVFNEIGASGVNTNNFENAGSMDPNDPNTIYVLDSESNFFSVDATTGVYTFLGTLAAPGGGGWVGLEFDTTTGDLYGLSGIINVSSTVSIIDIGAMTATPLGAVGAAGILGGIAIAIDGDGIIYVHDIEEYAIYTVDRNTGVGTYLGDTGFNTNYGQGMGYDQATNTIYLTAFNITLFDSELRTLDTSTGATTLIGLIEPDEETQYGWVSFESSVVIGVVENSLEGFNYYPNPTSGMLSLKSINNIDSVSIYNLLGQQLSNIIVGATSTDINLSGLSTGTYIMKVSVEGQIGTYKILKK